MEGYQFVNVSHDESSSNGNVAFCHTKCYILQNDVSYKTSRRRKRWIVWNIASCKMLRRMKRWIVASYETMRRTKSYVSLSVASFDTSRTETFRLNTYSNYEASPNYQSRLRTSSMTHWLKQWRLTFLPKMVDGFRFVS